MISRRFISARFMADLKVGLLSPILRRIQNDDTLMLGLRGTYINIYYRGGSILKLSEAGETYETTIDPSYLKNTAIKARGQLANEADVSAWLTTLPHLKSAIDIHLTIKHATEREFQQLVAWENNRSPLANETEYFITDVEYADQEAGARIDMLGVRWRGHERQSQQALVPVLIEMKYGNKALDGVSGMRKHLKDIAGLLEKKDALIRDTIKGQFDQLRELDLLKYNPSTRAQNPNFSSDARPEVIFLLAKYNPRSAVIEGILTELQGLETGYPGFDLRFFVAAFAGYGMHHACMLTTAELLKVIERFPRGKTER